ETTAQANYGSAAAPSKFSQQSLFIDRRSLEPIDDYVFEIKTLKPSRAIPDTDLFLEGSLWQVTLEDEKYQMSECCVGNACDSYVLFDVFSKDDENPVAQIGVSPRQTKLFENVRGYKSEDLEELISIE